MDVLQRLQPLDVLFVLLWAAIVGWGLQSGVVRQLGMLIGVYAAVVASGTAYRQVGQTLGQAFVSEPPQQLLVVAYVVVFLFVFVVVALIIWSAYPLSRIGRRFGADNVLGAVVAGIWGILLLISILTMLRFYIATPWRGQELNQSSVRGQVEQSQLAPVLEVVAAPLWQVLTPWFPSNVAPRL